MQDDGKSILASIKSYQQQIHDMDQKIAQYLSNRAELPRPRHRELITAVRRFENGIQHSNFGFLNTEIHIRLDNLMYSLWVHEQCWDRLFETEEGYHTIR